MKATSDFSWTKIICMFGAGLAVFFAFVNGGSAGILLKAGHGFNGFGSIASCVGWLGVAFGLYKYYQKWDRANNPGVKIEDIQKTEKK